ncbi:MAG: Alkaline phosphatase [Acidimicrobiales bacterium]|nr:Alkaline phosphatase [Acidimicrobiales bacterium]
MAKVVAAVASVGVAVAVLPDLGGARSQVAGTTAFKPVADTYVSSSSSSGYGTSDRLRVDSKPERQVLLRFKVAGVSGPVTSARLRLHVVDRSSASSKSGGELRTMSDTTWSEDVTWKKKPKVDGKKVGSLAKVARNTWYEIDVTSAVTGNGTFSFALMPTASDNAEYDSRETGATSPQLVVDAGGGVTTTTKPGTTTTRPGVTTTTTRPGTTTTTTKPAPTPGSATFVGAGDIGTCSGNNDEATAKLLDKIPGTVFAAGDNTYDSGTAQEFKDCYGPTWGRHKDRTYPVPGNHEYKSSGAKPYFDYFGARAGEPGKGYYSYEVGPWHVVSLNSNCGDVNGGCGSSSPQAKWLAADLAASAKKCTAVVWHHPLFSSGKHGNNANVRPLYEVLYGHGVEVLLTGHDHTYERFAPQDPSGKLDRDKGVREFVVGMGGKSHYSFGNTQPNREAGSDNTDGVIKFTLKAGSYDWEYVAIPGDKFTDSGSGTCH